LYAYWIAKSYTIYYDGNGETPATQKLNGTFGSAYPVPTTPTRTGYTFVGWFAEKEGGTQIYPGETLITRA